jgi:hypothetical protein
MRVENGERVPTFGICNRRRKLGFLADFILAKSHSQEMQGRGASLAALAGIALLALTCVHADHDETKDESSGFNTMATNLPDYGGDEWKACTPGISKWEDITSTYIS